MIADRIHAVLLEQFCDLFHALARAAVDDAASPLLFLEEAQKRQITISLAAHLKIEIRPIKARRHGIRVFKLQQAHDVRFDRLRCRRGECAHARPFGQTPDKGRDIQIARAKILSPLADAVRLIDHHLRNIRLHGKIQKAARQQPFRRNIDDLVHTLPGIVQRAHILSLRERGIEIRRTHAVLQKSADLIAHERNKRRDDQRDPRQHQRRNLIAQRLTRARRHDGHHIAARQDRRYNTFLSRTKAVIAEHIRKRLSCRL